MAHTTTAADIGRHTAVTGGTIVTSGAIAGIVGGLLMAAFAMMYTAVQGIGFWAPTTLIAATLVGVDALIGGPGIVLLGLIIHMAASIAWGVLFAWLFPRRAWTGVALVLGLLYAMGVLLVMTFLVMPVVNRVMLDRVVMMFGAFMIEHLLSGAGLTLVPWLERRGPRA